MARTKSQNEWRARNSRVQVNIELNPTDHENWKAYAEELGQTLPGMVRQAVKQSMAEFGWDRSVKDKKMDEQP